MDSASGINYALSASYAPQGALASVVHGQSGGFGGITLAQAFNNRLQPSTIAASSSNGTVLDFAYCFNSTVGEFTQGCGITPVKNNGNVARIVNNRDTARSQRFTYDELNRIETARTQATSGTHAWGLQFGYDVWANLLSASVIQGSAPMLSVGVNTKNQINNTGFVYDAAGNLTADGSLSMSYDAENRMTSAAGVSYTYDAENRMTATNAGVSYTYDGDGKRVKKGTSKLYWYGAGTDTLVETDASGNNPEEYVFFGGRRIARRKSTGEINYYFADHLGSSRVVTNATGTILDDSDFYPFGGERIVVNNDPNPYKFTGKERDAESGLDNFGARYFGSNMGRFMSPDEFWKDSHVGDLYLAGDGRTPGNSGGSRS